MKREKSLRTKEALAETGTRDEGRDVDKLNKIIKKINTVLYHYQHYDSLLAITSDRHKWKRNNNNNKKKNKSEDRRSNKKNRQKIMKKNDEWEAEKRVSMGNNNE